MKKKENLRLFNFSDSKLATLTAEKLAFMRRDADAFLNFGLTEPDFVALENQVIAFENLETDGEALGTQTTATADKEVKAEELRVAIRGIMFRVVLKYKENSATYRKFGTEALAQQSDAELLLVAKRVVRTATELLPELAPHGVTAVMLTNIIALKEALENLVVDMKMKMSDREIKQENRVVAANAIYSNLVRYANTGLAIWATTNVAKYNDYVIYEG